MKTLAIFLIAALSLLSSHFIHAQTLFEEVATSSGIIYNHKSWGSAWGDANGDDWPDLFVSNHFRDVEGYLPMIYINQGDGNFYEVVPNLNYDFVNDLHGAGWADFDNDDDQDLIILGGQGRNALLENMSSSGQGSMEDIVEEQGLLTIDSRCRTPLWVDANYDGLLDVVITNSTSTDQDALPSSLFLQQQDSFVIANTEAGFHVSGVSNLPILADLNRDRKLDLLVVKNKQRGIAFDMQTMPFTTWDIFNGPTEITDVATGDFDGDLYTDLYFVRNMRQTNVVNNAYNELWAYFWPKATEHEFLFKADGDVSFSIDMGRASPIDIYLGAGGMISAEKEFDLSSLDPTYYGIYDHAAGVDDGLYIGMDTLTGLWQVCFSSSAAGNGLYVNIITADSVHVDSVAGFAQSPEYLDDFLLFNRQGYFSDSIQTIGIDPITGSTGCVVGDFDNDMDLDLYLVCSSVLPNLPNRLYKNLGNGQFTEVDFAAGASGSTLGTGESVTTVDYNRDGFLDLFVTNSKYEFFQGPYELFKNLGNSNNWLEIKLTGTVSNRDGIGAVLILSAGGKSQLREQNGGTHRHTQNDKTIHFGLASNNMVDSITIYWPSGIEQKLFNINVNQLLEVQEPGLSCPAPSRLTAENITSNSVSLHWEMVPGSFAYRIRGNRLSTSYYVNYIISDTSFFTSMLSPETSYEWTVQAACNNDTSKFSEIDTFTTLPPARQWSDGTDLMFTVYPNPAEAYLHIAVNTADYEKSIVAEIYDMAGRSVLRSRFSGSQNLQRIDVGPIPQGMYSLRLIMEGNGKMYDYTFMKQ